VLVAMRERRLEHAAAAAAAAAAEEEEEEELDEAAYEELTLEDAGWGDDDVYT
jgi:hypothetical protein